MGRKPQPSNKPAPDFLVGENRGVNPRGVSYDRKINDQMESLKGVGQFAWESLPGIGTAYTIQDIKDELAKEEPNYYMIGALAGAEVIGLIPGLGDAAAELIKKGARSAGKLGSKIDRAVDQTTSLLGGPKAEDSVKNEMAGFTGQNPPTYIPKDESPFDPDGIYETKDDVVRFREPIAEFTRKLTMTNSFPSKGMTGAEFLRLLEKNAESIPPSSYKEGLVDKDKRYTREQLLDAVTKSPAGLPESIYYNLADLAATPQFGNYQRQTEVGFTGYPRYPQDTSYFSIPILSRTSGNTFKSNYQHFDSSTTAHVRGSFIDPLVGFEVNKTLSPEFKSIVGKDRPYLLVEEIQSDLLQRGYLKPKDSFDVAFDRATNETMAGAPVTFYEMYGDVTNELKSLIKTLESKDIVMPEEPMRLQLPYKTGVLNHPQFKERKRKEFLEELRAPERGTVDNVSVINFDEILDYINQQGVNSSHIYQVLNDIADNANTFGYLNRFESIAFQGPDGKIYDDIVVKVPHPEENNGRYIVDSDSPGFSDAIESFNLYSKEFGLNYDDIADIYDTELNEYYDAIDKEIKAKNLDKDFDSSFVTDMYERFRRIKAEETLLGDQTNTALPPVRKNKQTVEEALKLLIAKADQEGVDKIVIPSADKIAAARGRTIDPSDKGDRFYRTYVTDLNKALKDLEKNYPVTVHRDIDLPYKDKFEIPPNRKGTIIDISKLREQFQVDKPRQFAEGGSIRPKLRPEGFANATSPKPRLRPSEDKVRYVDAVFRGEDGDIITSPEENNPVTMLGLTRGDTFRQYPKDNLNVKGLYFLPTDEAEGGPSESKMQEFYSREKPDSPPLLIDDILIAGKQGVEDRYTAAHEFMHRGFNVLRRNHTFDEVNKRFGRATAQILFSEDSDLEHALVQSILEKEGKIAGIDYTSNNYLEGVSKETRDKLKKSVEDIYELSNETLGEAGYQTDRDRGPTTRQGRRGAKPKSFWSFITEKLGFAEGGTVDMNQQMSFAFEDGGLRDDGMMRDPVSGNEVPPGSTAKEVRDDIPAQLSEGEYVVPADVVRYYGVKFFEDLRDEAKRGLQEMEANGRIGGEPVPAGGPMADDLTPEEMAAIQEMMGMNQGGFVDMYQQQQNLYSAPNPAMNNQMGMASGGQVRGYNQAGSVSQPQQAEQGFYQAGQQAQQAAFTGFPLGATIFPSVETAVEPVPEPETTSVTLYGPNYLTDSSQVVILTLPADQTRYEQLIAQGYTTEMPVATASDNGGGTPPPPTETKPAYEDWLNSADFNSEAGIEKFIAGIEYDPSKSKLDMQTLGATVLGGPMAGLATAAGGALRGGGLQAISDLRAASLIAKAQGLTELSGKIDAQVADIIKDGPGILDFLDNIFATGKQKANAWAKTQGHSDIETATEAGVTPKPPTTSPTPPAQTAAKKAVSEYESLKKPSGGDDDDPFPTVVTDKSIAETKAIMDKQTSDTVEDTTKNLERTTAKVADIQSGKNTSGQVGFGKGGLMAKGKKKKK